MPDPQFIQLPFGPGLDKETGAMVVKPNSMQDLRNVYHHEGSLAVRSGTEKTNQFTDGPGSGEGTGEDATHILAGIAIRSERAGIVVSYYEPENRVSIWRVNALGEESVFVGFWPFRSSVYGTSEREAWPAYDDDPPKVVLAEMYGQVFFAHDTYYDSFRADTYHYNPWGLVDDSLRLGPLSSDFLNEGAPQVIRFRGVVRHLHYLFGWWWGSSVETRPELVRVSLPGEPTKFDPSHYFIAGDRRDPVVACEPARQTLLVCKETETYQIIGYSRATFGIRPYDQLYGSLASRLITSVSGTVYVWSAEGPMAGGDVGPFEKIWLPLDLDGFEPATLVARTDFIDGWADYIDEVELVIFTFGRRVYVLSVRNPADPRWTYWELGKKAFCGFRLYGGEGVGGVPTGHPEVDTIAYEVEGCGTYPKYIVTVDNVGQSPTDLVEIYHRAMGPFWEDNILADPLNVDTNADGIPDNWEYDVNAPSGPTSIGYYDGSKVAYYLGLFSGDDGTTTAHYIELKWVTGAVVVGDKYRFAADCYTPGPEENVYGNGPWQIECQFYDSGDNPVGAKQSRGARCPVFQRIFMEVTAPATATYAKVGLRGDIKQAGQTIAAWFRNPVWREQDVLPSAWVPAISPVLVSPEVSQELPPVTVAEPGMDYEFACRYINLGLQATAGYEDTSDPGTWPAISRGTALTEMDAPDWAGFFGSPPNLLPGQYFDTPLARYFEMHPGCDEDGGVGVSGLKYTNRDLEVYEDGGPLAYMHRGEIAWFRQLRFADQTNTYQYKMRYIGPDRNSPFGSDITLLAGVQEEVPAPTILHLANNDIGDYGYWIRIRLNNELYDHNGDGVRTERVGVEIHDNYDPSGPGSLLPAGQWRTAFVSFTTYFIPGGAPVVFPVEDFVPIGKKGVGLTLDIRVREYYEPFPDYRSNPNETFEPTNVSEWTDIYNVTIA